MIVWSCKAAIGCSECIFSACYSEYLGGALCFDITTSTTFTNTPLSFFCLFNDNTGSCGNDAYFHQWKPNPPFLFCFSTTPRSPRVVPSGNDDNWFPHGTTKDRLTFHHPSSH